MDGWMDKQELYFLRRPKPCSPTECARVWTTLKRTFSVSLQMVWGASSLGGATVTCKLYQNNNNNHEPGFNWNFYNVHLQSFSEIQIACSLFGGRTWVGLDSTHIYTQYRGSFTETVLSKKKIQQSMQKCAYRWGGAVWIWLSHWPGRSPLLVCTLRCCYIIFFWYNPQPAFPTCFGHDFFCLQGMSSTSYM